MNRALRLRLTGNRTRVRNWLNRRALDRGRTPLPDRIARQFSGLPVYRNRINRATGMTHRHDRRIGAAQDRGLARQRDARMMPDAYRSGPGPQARDNRQYVRDTLAARQPQHAQALERATQVVGREMARQHPASRSGRSR